MLFRRLQLHKLRWIVVNIFFQRKNSPDCCLWKYERLDRKNEFCRRKISHLWIHWWELFRFGSVRRSFAGQSDLGASCDAGGRLLGSKLKRRQHLGLRDDARHCLGEGVYCSSFHLKRQVLILFKWNIWTARYRLGGGLFKFLLEKKKNDFDLLNEILGLQDIIWAMFGSSFYHNTFLFHPKQSITIDDCEPIKKSKNLILKQW